MNLSIGIAALSLGSLAGTLSTSTWPQEQKADAPKAINASYVHDFERVEEEDTDPASLPVKDGIVWYGTWEEAMKERERTGMPVMLHMGSPRDRSTRVPGAW